MLNKSEMTRSIKGIEISGNNDMLNRLLFADDLMIVVRAANKGARHFGKVLDRDSAIRGQEVNLSKSDTFFRQSKGETCWLESKSLS